MNSSSDTLSILLLSIFGFLGFFLLAVGWSLAVAGDPRASGLFFASLGVFAVAILGTFGKRKIPD